MGLKLGWTVGNMPYMYWWCNNLKLPKIWSVRVFTLAVTFYTQPQMVPFCKFAHTFSTNASMYIMTVLLYTYLVVDYIGILLHVVS